MMRVLPFAMKKYRVLLLGVVAGATSLLVSSCSYDPYYSGSSVSYGYGHGYGGSQFSTSYFVGTGSSQWGYDPRVRCYYDYHRRAYYDPYLYGYYPVGYRPTYVIGTPHPHGWRQGSHRISPPSRIRSYNLDNYHNRGDRYRSLGTDWSRNIQVNNQQPSRQGGYDRYSRPGSGYSGNMWNRRETSPQAPQRSFFGANPRNTQQPQGYRGGDYSSGRGGSQWQGSNTESPRGFTPQTQQPRQYQQPTQGDSGRTFNRPEGSFRRSNNPDGASGRTYQQRPQVQPRPEVQPQPRVPQTDRNPEGFRGRGAEGSAPERSGGGRTREIRGLGEAGL